MENAPKRKKMPLWLVIALIVVLGAALGFGGRLIYVMLNPASAFKTQPTLQVTPAPVPEKSPAAKPVNGAQATIEPTPEPTPEPTIPIDYDFMRNRVNILMLGWDRSPEREVTGTSLYRDEENNFRSDVLMLLAIDFDNNKADLISVPRDSLQPLYTDENVLYCENSHWKINAAFAKGGSAGNGEIGFKYAMNTVSHVFGIPIDYYAGVDMEGLKALVDAMGGIDYDVDLEIKLNGRVLNKGMQTLTGQQVLDYCRARKGYGTDQTRNDRQQRMLFALFAQLKSRDQLKNVPKIYLSMKDYVRTNLSVEQMAALASFAMNLDIDSSLNRHCIKGEYIDKTPYNNASFFVYHNDELVKLVEQVFGFTITPSIRNDASYVLADKAADSAMDYVRGAEYVLKLPKLSGYVTYDEYGQSYTAQPAIAQLTAQMATMTSLATRDVGTFTDAKEFIPPASVTDAEGNLKDPRDIPFDTELIAIEQEKLRALLYNVCISFGVTQDDIDPKASQMPKEFIALLPQISPYYEEPQYAPDDFNQPEDDDG